MSIKPDTKSFLHQISINKIVRNPENPRLLFRPRELEALTESIRKFGVQVPISVYKEKDQYVLIDGERRWKCSLKLNRPTIPALIQDKPDELTNLTLMFNIHALREHWDLLTIALKLPRIMSLLKKRLGKDPTEQQLADNTALPLATIRRCKLLMNLPQEYKTLILEELNKPKDQQRLTEDFFIEMERSLTTVKRSLPEVIPNPNRVRKILIEKYKDGIIVNRVDFRKIAKIARADRVNVDRETAKKALDQLFTPNRVSIEHAFEMSVAEAYFGRNLSSRIESVLHQLRSFETDDLDSQFIALLQELISTAQRLLKNK
jgi:ParB family transcriptional regulator, chromosome partitioning protein